MTAYYFAATYDRHAEMREYRNRLQAALSSATVTSRWIDLHGGDLPQALGPDVLNDDPDLGESFALADLSDIDMADVLVAFTGGNSTKGGRHVELGYALETGMTIALVGRRENVFHCLEVIDHYPTWEDFLAAEQERL
jgi:hypothetical protein